MLNKASNMMQVVRGSMSTLITDENTNTVLNIIFLVLAKSLEKGFKNE